MANGNESEINGLYEDEFDEDFSDDFEGLNAGSFTSGVTKESGDIRGFGKSDDGDSRDYEQPNVGILENSTDLDDFSDDFESFEYETSGLSAEIEFDAGISIDDLESISLTADDDEDMEAFLAEKAALEELGYQISPDADFEDLEVLKKRERVISKAHENQDKFTLNRIQCVDFIESRAKASRVTYTPSDSLDNSIYLRNNGSMSGTTNKKLRKMIEDSVHQAAALGVAVDIEDIILKIKRMPDYSDFAKDFNEEYIRSYAKEAIPILQGEMQMSKNFRGKLSKHREKVATYLFKEQRRQVNDLRKSFESNNLFYVRQINNEFGAYKMVCPGCGKLIEMNHSPFTLIRFDTEKSEGDSGSVNFIPKPYVCENGHSVIFTGGEYSSMQKLALSGNHKMKDAIDHAAEFCKGSSCIYLEPAVNSVIKVVDYIVVTSGNEDNKAVDDEEVVAKQSKIHLDDSEFVTAMKDFYNKLRYVKDSDFDLLSEEDNIVPPSGIREMGRANLNNTMQDFNEGFNENETHFKDRTIRVKSGIKKVAFYAAKLISQNYKDLKNMAIYSLITWVMDNKILSKYLDSYNEMTIENTLEFLDSVNIDLIDILSPDRKRMLCLIAGDLSTSSSEPILYNKMSEEEIIKWLVKHRSLLVDELNNFRNKKEICMEMLEKYVDTISQLKITKMSTFRMSDLTCYLCNDRFNSWLDVTSDMMIITNYAEVIFKRLQEGYSKDIHGASGMFKPNVGQLLNDEADTQKLLRKLEKVLEFKEYKNYNQILQPRIEECDRINRLIKIIHSGNYYRYCKVLQEVPTDCSYDSDDFPDSDVNAAIRNLSLKAEQFNNVSEVDWLFSDQLSKEEIEQNKASLEMLTLTQNMPVRGDGESVADYVTRIKEFTQTGNSETELRFLGVDIDSDFKDILFLSIASLRGSGEFESYTSAMYAIMALKSIASNYEGYRTELGISDTINTIINSELEEVRKQFVVDVTGNKSLTKLFTRILVGTVASVVDKRCQDYDKTIVSVLTPISEIAGREKVVQVLRECVDDMEEAELTASDTVVDAEDATNEIVGLLVDDDLKKVIGG